MPDQETSTAALVETDPAVRNDLFGQIQPGEQQNGPFAPLFQPGVHLAYKAALKGFAYNGQWRGPDHPELLTVTQDAPARVIP
jgi:ABC-type transport system substrate-binding protein